ncbi:MAG: nuclear transport factor 2 family protein [Nocardioidaceae bacterium]
MTGVEQGLERWHAVVAAQDPSGLPAIITEDAVFHSPAVHAPQPGRDMVVAYLTAALRVLGPHFRYERSWTNESSAVLEFITRLDDREVQGVDIIEFTEDGLIRDFTVLVRPQSALTKVIEHMSAELTRMLGG